MSLQVIQNKHLYVELSPDMGASITKFTDKVTNYNIFRPFPKNKKINKTNSYFSAYFATIPYFGAVHKNTFLYKNKYINLSRTHPLERETIHGEGWVNKWKILNKNENSIKLYFKHNPKKSFPFKYEAEQEFALKKTSLIIKIKIKNLDFLTFDCGIGFHPWFNLSNYSKVYSNSFNYNSNSSEDNFKNRNLLKNKFLDLNKYKLDKTFLRWDGKSKLILDKNISLEIINKKNINNLHIFTPQRKKYYCIEPVTNVRNSFYLKKFSNEYTGLYSLKSNRIFEAKVEFKLIK